MKRKNGTGESLKVQDGTVRASISFPSDIYQTLEELAKRNKLSLAWVVRDAAERYVAERTAGTARSRGDARLNGSGSIFPGREREESRS